MHFAGDGAPEGAIRMIDTNRTSGRLIPSLRLSAGPTRASGLSRSFRSGLRSGDGFVRWARLCGGLVLASALISYQGRGEPHFQQESQVQQPSGPTLKVSTEVVNVYAIVEGKHHNLVPNLEKQDFQ